MINNLTSTAAATTTSTPTLRAAVNSDQLRSSSSTFNIESSIKKEQQHNSNENIASIKTTTKTTKYYSEDDNNSSDNYNCRQKFIKLRHQSLPRTTLLYPILNRTTTSINKQQFYPTWDEWKERHKLIKEKTPIPISKKLTASGNINETEATTTTTTTTTTSKNFYEEVYNKKLNDNHSINIEKQEEKKHTNEVENKEQNNNYNNREKLELITKKRNQQNSIEAFNINYKTQNLEDYINKNSKLIEDRENYYKNKEIEAKYLENQINSYMQNTFAGNSSQVKKFAKYQDEQQQKKCFTRSTEDESTAILPIRKEYFETMSKISGTDNDVHLKHTFNESRSTGKVNLNTNRNASITSLMPVEASTSTHKATITSATSKRNNSLTNYNSVNNTTKSMKSTRLTESDSDTETQNKLLAKASGSIPIEYISIRRDPKPTEKKEVNLKKSVTTGTNTIVERGKRVATTNTDTEPEIPKYNLHLSLDSLIKKNEKREVSTSTERVKFVNKSAATEIERKKDAYTLTSDAESDSDVIHIPIIEAAPPPPPPQQEHYAYRSRRARYEWETRSSPGIRDEYRLELLAKSPRTLRKRQNFQHQSHKCSAYEDETDISDVEYSKQRNVGNNYRMKYDEICIDDDDKLIFGETYVQQRFQQQHHYHENEHQYHRSGSYPALIKTPLKSMKNSDDLITTRRYIRNTKTYTPQIIEQVNVMPLKSTENIAVNDMSSYFKEMHSKFNEIFSTKRNEFNIQNNNVVQTFYEPGLTNRLVIKNEKNNINPLINFLFVKGIINTLEL